MIKIEFPFCSDLGPLETFDSKIFCSDDKVDQDVCNFILCLSCVYNDFKNVLTYLYMFDEMSSKFKNGSAEWGEVAGLNFYFVRLIVSINHELIKLIKTNREKVIEKPFFKALIKSLDKTGQECWDILISVANEQKPKDKLSEFLRFARNKIGSHYDTKEIFEGYKQYFVNNKKQKPYISKSNLLSGERHYFSEAAMQGYFEKQLSDNGTSYKEICSLSHKIGPAISQIVKIFIEKRLNEEKL